MFHSRLPSVLSLLRPGLSSTTPVVGLCLLICPGFSFAADRLVSPEQVQAVHENLRASWAKLGNGFHYSADSTIREYAVGVRGKVDGRERIVRIDTRDEPVVFSANIDVTAKDDGYIVVSKTDEDPAGLKWHATGEKLYAYNKEGRVYTVVPRSPENEENQIRFTFFVPGSGWDDWAGFPWPPKLIGSGEPATVKIISSDANVCVVHVDGQYDTGNGQKRPLRRVITYHNLPEFGWLPVKFERSSGPERPPTRVDEVTWGWVGQGSGAVIIPLTYAYTDYARDPTDGTYVMNRQRSIEIRPEAFAMGEQASARSSTSELAAGPPLFTPLPVPAQVDHAASAISPYLIAFVLFLLAAFVLWQLPRRKNGIGFTGWDRSAL